MLMGPHVQVLGPAPFTQPGVCRAVGTCGCFCRRLSHSLTRLLELRRRTILFDACAATPFSAQLESAWFCFSRG